MNENKTKPTSEDVAEFFATLSNEQRQESETLAALMHEVSNEPAVMWGTSIVGFGRQHYKYASGREGDWMKIGFAPRKGRLSLYATCDVTLLKDELANLGSHTTGKGCIYIRHLADVDEAALRVLLEAAYAQAGTYAN